MKNRFTGWSDGEIAEYIRIEKSNHATKYGFWVGGSIAFSFVSCIPDGKDSTFVLFLITLFGIGALCFFSVEKGKKRLLELEREDRRIK